MTKRKYAELAERMIPETPAAFKQAMRQTLDEIVLTAPKEETNEMNIGFGKRRALVIALAVILLIATVAVAATQWHIFDTLSFMTGSAPKNADQVMQANLYQTTVNDVEITIKEAGYDGKTLFIQYSYRMKDVDRCLGLFAEEYKGTVDYGMEGIGEDDMRLLYDRNVGWWIDHLWIDGKSVDMPNNSGATTSGSATPGEIVQTEYWRLDNEDVQLSGKVSISLPIGERQSVTEFYGREDSEKYGEDGTLLPPEKGLVTFTLDTSDILSRVRYEYPNVPARGENVTAQVSEVCYSPLMTYITLKLEGDADAIAAYKAEHGEGFMSEDGKTMLWEYGGMEVFDRWIGSLELVDGEGRRLFPGMYGNNGYGNEWAEFVYPYIDDMPQELYLAPFADGTADMTQAVKVK